MSLPFVHCAIKYDFRSSRWYLQSNLVDLMPCQLPCRARCLQNRSLSLGLSSAPPNFSAFFPHQLLTCDWPQMLVSELGYSLPQLRHPVTGARLPWEKNWKLFSEHSAIAERFCSKERHRQNHQVLSAVEFVNLSRWQSGGVMVYRRNVYTCDRRISW